MESEGASYKDACANIYLMDIDGLITTRRRNMNARHEPFAKEMNETKDLLQVVEEVKPHALIGASTVRGAFNESVVRTMAKLNSQVCSGGLEC